MSEATQLLTSLERQGVVFYAEGSHLRYRAPKGVLTEELRGQLIESKDALLAVWRERAANSVASHPGTYGQKALWFLHRALPESAAYNVVFTARIRSAVDLPALRCACQALMDRHAALRTTFVIEEGQLVQRVHGYVPMHVQVFDRPDKDVEALREEVIGAARAPFDLQSGPLMRVQLFTRSPNDHVILIALHHIAADGWSLFLLLDDLRWLYPLGRNGAGPAPPRPAHDVLAYCRWQKEMLAGRDGQEHESYWLKELAGEIPPLSLPTDRSRSSLLTDHGATLAIDLGAELSSAVRSLAAAEGTTTFVVLLAAYQILLHRWTGQPEVIVGSPTYGRDRPEFANVVGDFINMIPLKGKVHEDPPFRGFLAQLRRATIEGIKHQDYPFPLLVEKLNPQRELARSPVFQTMFILQRFKQLEGLQRLFLESSSADRLDFGGLALEPFPIPQQEGQFELSLELTEKEGAFQGSLKYSTDLFGRETIERLARHYVRLLQGIVAAPETRVSRLPLLEVEEQERIVVEWNQTRVNYGEIACLHELFQAQVDRSPESVAVVFEGRTLTYRDLEVRANQVAHFLRKLGVAADSLVGICVERSLEMVIGLLGILKAGGAYVPLDPSYPEDRLAFMLEDAGVSVLLSQNHVVGRLPSHRAKTICLDADWDRIARESRDRLSACARPDNLAYMIYTSGSTGRPKGAMITHRGIFNRLLWMQEQYRLSQNDAVLQKTPFSFDVSVWEFFWPLLAGARLVVARPGGHQDPAYLIDVIAREHITITHFVPSMLRVFLEAEGLERCGTLREVICSGEALAPDLVKRFYSRLGANLHNLYGPTEAAVDVTYWSCPRGSELSVVPIGRPLANTQCYILDAQMQPVPVGVPGELHLGGVQVGRGYYRRPELTAEKFIADPFSLQPGARLYKTGDLCRYLPDGCIEYLGRVDHQVKLRGFRIELGEVEACLAKHPTVKDVVVVVQNDPSNEPRLAAYLVGSDGSPADPEELREYLRARLPEYMVPSFYVILDKLPLSPNGKIDRKALPALAGMEPTSSKVYLAPSGRIEQLIADIWRQVLKVERVGLDDNFFDLGGHSLLMIQANAALRKALARDIAMVEMFQYPTVRTMAKHLGNGVEESAKTDISNSPRVRPRPVGTAASQARDAIAIIGMAGRFPDAPDLRSFWQNLRNGVESIRPFTDEELIAAGVAPEVFQRPDYVRNASVLEGADLFDAGFFGFAPREAEIMDPQQRLLLECAWEVFEDAGYDPGQGDEVAGVFVGCSANVYLWRNLLSNPKLVAAMGGYQMMISNEKDYAATRICYKLNLKGPGITVQTACSTSLVAVQVACQSLLTHQCDLALAGGASVRVPQRVGYLFQEGMIMSPDGHCRAFDAKAAGTVSGEGAGLVLLKRLSDALADRDHIRAVILGVAINNDGSLKAGYTAPSVEGQATVISTALAGAGVSADSISYVEAHGTGTPLGDPIEIAALAKAYQSREGQSAVCGLGSLKTNLGHLDVAAGIASLIKTVLALEHGEIPPSLHFETPNPKLGLEKTRFRVNQSLRPWLREVGATPERNRASHRRRAGVSSFGIGGTNAHLILEEAPTADASDQDRSQHLLVFSAKSDAALDNSLGRFVEHLERTPDLNLGDAAFTLQVGRRAFGHRCVLICENRDEALRALKVAPSLAHGEIGEHEPRIVFMFSGQGSQYARMGFELYREEPLFARTVDDCLEILRPHLSRDLRDALLGEVSVERTEALNQTALAQPSLFVIEYALARLWMSWGINPESMIGHSIGEYAAACLAGTFSLDDALALVAARGRLMQDLPPGSMIAIPLGEDAIREVLVQNNWGEQISLAALNAPMLSVVSGPTNVVAGIEAHFNSKNLATRRLHTSHAFHSPMMDPILSEFTARVKAAGPKPPRIPYISNLTGQWITPEEATDPSYYARHLRHTVRFSAGLRELLREPARVFLEVGPGKVLTSFARKHAGAGGMMTAVPSMRGSQDTPSDVRVLLTAAGQLWLWGARFDWSGFHGLRRRHRVALPSYPFERQRFWVQAEKTPEVAQPPQNNEVRLPIDEWFSVPIWKSSLLPTWSESTAVTGQVCLLFTRRGRLEDWLKSHLLAEGLDVICVSPGDHFASDGLGGYLVNHENPDDYDSLLRALKDSGRFPALIVHCWSLGSQVAEATRLTTVSMAINHGFYSLLFLSQALERLVFDGHMHLKIVVDGIAEIAQEVVSRPENALALGSSLVIGQTIGALRCSCIDIPPHPEESAPSETFGQLLIRELLLTGDGTFVALRGKHRWLRSFEPLRLPASRSFPSILRERGVYLITGGLGGIAMELADYLARTAHARLVLLGRTSFPPRSEWDSWVSANDKENSTTQLILRVRALESIGADILVVQADVCDPMQTQAAITRAESHFGPLNGVIHAAGVAGQHLLSQITRESACRVLEAKVHGTLALENALGSRKLDFLVLCSSLSTALGGLTFFDYAAANSFLDAFAFDYRARTGVPTVAIDWDGWRDVGMSLRLERARPAALPPDENIQHSLSASEGREVFARILAADVPQVVVSTRDLSQRLNRSQSLSRSLPKDRPVGQCHPRPALRGDYVPPRNETELLIAGIWQELLGLEKVGIHDDFFELGGDSLIAVQVFSRLRSSLGKGLPLQSIFESPTIALLAAAIETMNQTARVTNDEHRSLTAGREEHVL